MPPAGFEYARSVRTRVEFRRRADADAFVKLGSRAADDLRGRRDFLGFGHVLVVSSLDSRRRLEAAFRAHYGDIAAYCLRRCASPEDAEEAATEVFATAWRRIDSMPAEPEARLWLFGVARRVVANSRRAAQRRARLERRLRQHPSAATRRGHAELALGVENRDSVAEAALAALSAGDRELLLLIAWEGLAPREIARVLGVPAPIVSARLYRARRRLASALRLSVASALSTGDAR